MLQKFRRGWRRCAKADEPSPKEKLRAKEHPDQNKPIFHHYQSCQDSKVYVNTKCLEQYGSNSECECDNCSVIERLFQCPICYNTLSGTFYSCLLNEHLVCDSCRKNLKECPLCRDTKFLKVEKGLLKRIRDETSLPCSYSSYGCKSRLLGEHLLKHEKTCPYRPLKCPLDPLCQWQGTWEDCLRHVTASHKCEPYDGASFNFVIPNAKKLFLQGIPKKFSIVRAHNDYFLLQFHSLEYCVVLSLTLIRAEVVPVSDYSVNIKWNEEWSFSSKVPCYSPTSMKDPLQQACLVLTLDQLPEKDLVINMEVKKHSKRRSIH